MHTGSILHLEVLIEFSTDSFLLSLKQIMAWRRQGNQLMSDNETNVIDAERKLK